MPHPSIHLSAHPQFGDRLRQTTATFKLHAGTTIIPTTIEATRLGIVDADCKQVRPCGEIQGCGVSVDIVPGEMELGCPAGANEAHETCIQNIGRVMVSRLSQIAAATQ